MKKLLLALLVAMLPTGAIGQSFQTPTQSAPIAVITATTTLLITGVTGKQVVVIAIDVLSSATGTLLFISGTGATCGSNTVSVTGTYNMIANTFLLKGDGNGVLWPLPTGTSLCVTSTGAGNFHGSVTWTLIP